MTKVARVKDNVATLNKRLSHAMHTYLKNKKSELGGHVSLLQSVSPLSTLARGYSITMKENSTVNHVDDVEIGDEVKTRVTDGEITSKVVKINRQ